VNPYTTPPQLIRLAFALMLLAVLCLFLFLRSN